MTSKRELVGLGETARVRSTASAAATRGSSGREGELALGRCLCIGVNTCLR